MNLPLKILINDRDRAFHCNQWAKYHRHREHVISQICVLKRKFLDSVVSNKDSKKLWNFLRCLSRYRKNKMIHSDISCDDFNAFLPLIFSQRAMMFAQPMTMFWLKASHSFRMLIFFLTFGRFRIKALGQTVFRSWVFCECAPIVTSAVAYLFNKSLSERLMPSCFKVANVFPIHKVEKLRQVWLSPYFFATWFVKIFEKLVLKKIILPAVRDRVSSSQFAYVPRPGSRTTSALILLQHYIL